MNRKRKIVIVSAIGILALVLTTGWRVLAGGDGWPPEPWSLEGIWTTMLPTPAGISSINSFIITAQGAEGMVYTVVGKHPQCSTTGLGMFPEADRLSGT